MLRLSGHDFLLVWSVTTIMLGVVFMVFRRPLAYVMERNPGTPRAWRHPIPHVLLVATGAFFTLLGICVLVGDLLGIVR